MQSASFNYNKDFNRLKRCYINVVKKDVIKRDRANNNNIITIKACLYSRFNNHMRKTF